MTVEILYPAIANLYGEAIEVEYLEKCLPEARFIKTGLNETPAFANEKVDMIFMGPTTEKGQEIIIDRLKKYKSKIDQLIESGTVFLLTGNALEIFGKYIENDDGSKIEALGIFDTFAKRQMMKRYNSLFLGEIENTKIVGFKAQFSHSYGDINGEGLFKRIRGAGLNPDCEYEGIRRKNFFATYLLGPILIMNPDFTKYILSLTGEKIDEIPFEKDIRAAYEKRLGEFEKPDTVFLG